MPLRPSWSWSAAERLARAEPRRLRLRLTPKGRRLTVPRVGTVEASVRRTLGRFNAGDVARTRQVLTALSSALGLD